MSTQIQQTHFKNPALERLGIECMTLDSLRQRRLHKRLPAVERVDFYLLLWISEGQGHHQVDFLEHRLEAHTLLYVQPGQVQIWNLDPTLQGQLILVAPAALPSGAGGVQPFGPEPTVPSLADWPTCAQLPPEAFAQSTQAVVALQSELQSFSGSRLEVALIGHLLQYTLLRLERIYCELTLLGHPNHKPLYRQFLQALETPHGRRPSVREYAHQLGCAESTLSRACLAAEGRSAKQVIDRRVALDAARLLAHSQVSVAEISEHLGFSEPTNFVKFFHRVMGVSPARFRANPVPRYQ